MRKVTNKYSGKMIALYLTGLVPVVWLAFKSAPYFIKNGLVGILENAGDIFNNPFHITLVQGSLQVVLIFCVLYGIGIGIYLSTEKNYRRREEHGSAKWGDAGTVNKQYRAKPDEDNKILTQNVRIGFDGHKHKRNLNVLVVGGAGAGKTRYYAMPNILQANKNTKFSMVVLDPKGGTLRSCGNYLESQGYDVRVLDLINLDRSHCYNPFVYLESDDDIQRLTTNLIKNTTPKGSQTSDPFWDQAASMLLKALVFYLYYEAPPEEQNFPMVMDMIRAGDVKENDDDYESPLDIIFAELEDKDPEHIALKYYRSYHSGAAQTLKSIQISLMARLEKFNLPSLAGITQNDEMRLRELGEKPGAIFALIPDNDQSYNFIIGMNKFNSNNVTTLAKNKRNKALKRYLTVAITCAIVGVAMLPVMADSDAETAINNMSDIIFGIIRAIGIILSGWGLVQVGMSFQSHDPSQRSQGFLCLAGGLIIVFAKSILTAIAPGVFG